MAAAADDNNNREYPRCWNDVWDAYVNPNLNKYAHDPTVCNCGSDGFFLRSSSLICADCDLKIPVYRICPHTDQNSYTDFDSDGEGADGADDNGVFHGCIKCNICEAILESSVKFKYYLEVTCTHDFRHVGEFYDDQEDQDDIREKVKKQYCFQCDQFI
jgi:hypothetical protein